MRISHLCSMVAFPHAKINLGLHILAKRDDGYHDLETVLVPVGWCDALEVVPAAGRPFSFSQSGIRIYGTQGTNLCVRAWQLMDDLHRIGPVQMHLHKVIPTGAGLGGGSSDAACTLRMLNDLFVLGLQEDTLEDYAARLGSDCAFFIRNGISLATGRGDQLRPVEKLQLPSHVVIVKPKTGIRTTDAYKNVVPVRPEQPLGSLLKMPVTKWKKHVRNDFENSLFRKHPALARIKEKLYKLGAVYASLSGSGSALYGLFDTSVDAGPHFRGSTVYQGVL